MKDSISIKRYHEWLENPLFDDDTKAELKAISNDQKEIDDRFYQHLNFGTAGLRGILGAGTNRMNRYTVARAADGFARSIVDRGEEAMAKGIAISFDSRRCSPEFAELTARIFVKHGIKVYLSDRLRPVPMLSYTIRHFGCAGGVMITASHNPKVYNGFKAYGSDGGQMPPAEADAVVAKMAERDDYAALYGETPALEECRKSPLWHEFGEEIDKAYNDMLLGLSIDNECVKKQKDLKIIYTPLHGAGNRPVRRVLESLGFENIIVVPEQAEPNSEFPTAPYPNPEEREAMQMGIDLAEKEQADLLIATDPDADRTGVAVRTSEGDFVVLSGNQIGILLMDYILGAKQKSNTLPEKSFCVTTIVSTKLTRPIAEHYDVNLYEVLTGFKFIAEQIKNRDENGDEHFQFGFEESIGYLAGTEVRDKDAVVASMLIAEMAASAACEGKTLYDRLQDLYKKYGYGAEKTVSLRREGKEGLEKIAKTMAYLRDHCEDGFTGFPVTAVNDYQAQKRYNLVENTVETLDLPKSNVLLYELEGLDWFCARPSGTEPKLKIYMGFYDKDPDAAQQRFAEAANSVPALIEELLDA